MCGVLTARHRERERLEQENKRLKQENEDNKDARHFLAVRVRTIEQKIWRSEATLTEYRGEFLRLTHQLEANMQKYARLQKAYNELLENYHIMSTKSAKTADKLKHNLMTAYVTHKIVEMDIDALIERLVKKIAECTCGFQ